MAASLQAEDKGQRFTIVDSASLPMEPVFPDRQKLLSGGAAAALLRANHQPGDRIAIAGGSDALVG
ncbi:hypothetical protein, partial [Sphingobium sp.]|uniref:hypothetical protein n=1 Tax=Sphingobium sp. TaxID=1912891 RepID=UPI002CF29BA8